MLFDLPSVRFFWVEEVGELCLAWMSFIGAAIGIRKGIHFSVQMITDRLPPRARLACLTTHYLLIAAFGALVAVFGWQVAELNSQSCSPALDLNLRWLYLSSVVGGVLIVIYSLASIADGWRGRWPGFTDPRALSRALRRGRRCRSSSSPPCRCPSSSPWASSGFVGLLIGNFSLQKLPSSLVAGTQHWVLLAIPTFVFAGNLMERCGMSYALVNLARVLVGWVRGGLGMSVVLAEYFFSGISGSTIADVSAIGSMLTPPMLRAGYKPEHAVSLVASASRHGHPRPARHLHDRARPDHRHLRGRASSSADSFRRR